MRKAIFLDRDGTIIIDKHYQHKAEDIEYFDDTFECLRFFQEQGYELVVITNQSGIGRGYFTQNQMHELHEQMNKDIVAKGLRPYLDFYFCPHTPEDKCDCRKPSPKMINDACEKWEIDKNSSFMIGDKDVDVQAAQAAGVGGFKVKYPKTGLSDFKKTL